MSRLEAFRKERERLNARVLETATLETKRFFSLIRSVTGPHDPASHSG